MKPTHCQGPGNNSQAEAGRRIRRKLLNWYRRNVRDLPWRHRGGDGYAQWVAEIMLQQTQVDTVIPYYERFLQRFPDVGSLARARFETVLRYWQGLGYYRRAANLHRAARQVVRGGARFPNTVDELMSLPGVGRYTAGAIASIAFGRRSAAVDGNTARVLSRLNGELPNDATDRRLWQWAEQLLPSRGCGDFNQGLMELGALLCTPTSPRCDACPVRDECAANGDKAWRDRPTMTRRIVPDVRHVSLIVRRCDAVLMVRRPMKGLWAGLWEFPNVEFDWMSQGRPRARKLVAQMGLKPVLRFRLIGTLSHRLTHRLMHFEVYDFPIDASDKYVAPVGVRWVSVRRLCEVPMSTACRKMLAMAGIRTGCDPQSNPVRRVKRNENRSTRAAASRSSSAHRRSA